MITYRLAQPADAELYFTWANDPATRQQSFNSRPISPETHAGWFTRKLTDANALLLVFEQDGQPAGQVRFERTAVADMPAEIVISLSVDASFRGQGLASQLIEQGCRACREQWGDVTIHAYVKPTNTASARAFERAGFTLSGESGKFAGPDGAPPSLVYTQSA